MLTLLGLDIGTTSISAVAVSAEDGQVLHVICRDNDAALPRTDSHAMQDPRRILALIRDIKRDMEEQCGPFAAVGVTGQMHGILYLDNDNKPVSPLYTWQDESGDIPYEDGTYAGILSKKTGHRLASGYGLVTDFVLRADGERPTGAVRISTVYDWVASSLCIERPRITHTSSAASLGCFDHKSADFDTNALRILGVEREELPDVVPTFTVIGHDENGVPVTVAVGDNQASVLGSVTGEGCVLVNIGTGSQVSVFTSGLCDDPQIEQRPFLPGRSLLVGAPLCGGRSFALLKDFYARFLTACGMNAGNVYAVMDRMAEEAPDTCTLKVDTRFCGTRDNPSLRGTIGNISLCNFTPEEMTRGFLHGMADELYALYAHMVPFASCPITRLVGSGNAIRKSTVLKHYLSETFGLPLSVPRHREEAAFGAALSAAVGVGLYPDLSSAQNALIHYE